VHLARNKIIHRDLAARNILLQSRGSRVLAKVSDLGLSRQVTGNSSHYVSTSAKRPIRWTAPEALDPQIARFSTASDVWSFGVLYWEILTRGALPHGHLEDNATVIKYVQSGGGLSQPADCAAADYALVRQCTAFAPEDRPPFQAVFTALNALTGTSDGAATGAAAGAAEDDRDSWRAPTGGGDSYELMSPASSSSRANLLLPTPAAGSTTTTPWMTGGSRDNYYGLVPGASAAGDTTTAPWMTTGGRDGYYGVVPSASAAESQKPTQPRIRMKM